MLASNLAIKVMSQIEQIAPATTIRLRREVLYPDSSIESVILEEDNSGIHFGLYDNNKLITVVSLFLKGEEAQFRKFATDHNYQNMGYGSNLLNYITQYAYEQGVKKIWCHARSTAIPFYKKHHFSEMGSPFVKGNIEYLRMEKVLTEKSPFA